MTSTIGQIRSFFTEKIEKIASVPLFAGAVATSPTSTLPKCVDNEGLEPHPSVGFRVTFNPDNGKLTVNVVSARHLPANVARVPVLGYLVKVKLYPGKDKFETEQKPESWPSFNQHFNFQLASRKTGQDRMTYVDSVLTTSKFLTLTIFAIDKFQKRKSLGSVTWPLDRKLFILKSYARNDVLETAEIWKAVVDLSSGFSTLTGAQQKRIMQRAKDQIELTLCHENGEVGDDDVLTLRVDRLRWSIDKTKEYQHKTADMYVKLSVTNSFGQVMRCQKTLMFTPSISVHWPKDDPKGFLKVTVPPVGPRNKGYHCIVTLCAKVGKAGKKVHLGRTVIHQTPEEPDTESDHWTLATQAAGSPISQWHNLLDPAT